MGASAQLRPHLAPLDEIGSGRLARPAGVPQVQKAFLPANVASMEARIGKLARGLLDGVSTSARFDRVASMALDAASLAGLFSNHPTPLRHYALHSKIALKYPRRQ